MKVGQKCKIKNAFSNEYMSNHVITGIDYERRIISVSDGGTRPAQYGYYYEIGFDDVGTKLILEEE